MIPLSPFGLLFLTITATLIMALPRRAAAVPLMVGVCYMVLSQGVQIGPIHLFVIRILVMAGFLRALLRRERLAFGMQKLDWLMLTWALSAVLASTLHINPMDSLVANLGLAFNACGVYFLLRIFLASAADIIWLCRLVVLLLIPVAIEMLYENLMAHNLFSLLGGVPDTPDIRDGRLRAQGPFGHAILAGTVGAVCLPFAVAAWNEHRVTAYLGIAACIAMVALSASSGPIMTAIFAVAALALWPWRARMRAFRWAALGAYVLLYFVMTAPPYYLLARIDLTGSSTGWHRAELIDSAIRHLDEWWLAGTDYTRHWMPTGVSWSPDHTDITNHYLQLGVHGGLPLMLLFVVILSVGFSLAGRAARDRPDIDRRGAFFAWALGSALFAHAATGISVAYFDQSFAFVYVTLAAIVTFAAAEEKRAADLASARDIHPAERSDGHFPFAKDLANEIPAPQRGQGQGPGQVSIQGDPMV